MSLRDLVAKKSDIAESVIEAIVSKYVRYYVDTLEIGFTPECASLSSESKVLAYLVAILGWQYVTDKPPSISTKPADLERVLGIPGGTLRPLLKNLKEAHLIARSDDGYNVREGNLEAVAAAVNGEKKTARRKTAKPTSKVKTKAAANKSTSGNPISSKLDKWVTDGFFKTPRTLKSVHERFHEQGVIAPQTSVSGPLLRAVKQGRLGRRKIFENGKAIWAYCVVGA